MEWLEELLKGGSIAASTVYAKAKAEGIAEMTLRRAKDRLGIDPYKSSGDGPWLWQLPER